MQHTQKTISPVDQSLYAERPLIDASELSRIIDKAEKAQTLWQTTSFSERANVCKQMVEYFKQHQANIAEEICWQMGRPIRYCASEINGLEERANYMISIAEEALADLTPAKKQGFIRLIRREPLGTVLAIAPWNYPYLTAVNTIVPSIMAGNAVILKHASQTPLCAERFAEAFKYAGLPSGVFQILHASHDTIGQLIQSKMLDFVAFTGSVNAGTKIESLIAGQFIGSGLELGGKDPAYVREDANLNYSVEQLVDGAFFNSGQSCCGIERIYVHQSQYDDFLKAFVDLVAQYRLGLPTIPDTTIGPLVKTSAAQFVQKQIDSAVEQGAKLHIDKDHFSAAKTDTPYLAPQVLTNVNHNMSIMKEESFGPVVGIMKVKNDREAIQLMNDSQYGLTASIWTEDEAASLALAPQLKTGTVFMNRCDYLDPALVWTGVKNTGHGYSLSHYGYHQITRLKSYHFKTSTKDS